MKHIIFPFFLILLFGYPIISAIIAFYSHKNKKDYKRLQNKFDVIFLKLLSLETFGVLIFYISIKEIAPFIILTILLIIIAMAISSFKK